MPLVGDMVEQSLLFEDGEDFSGFAVACVRAAGRRHKTPLNAQLAVRWMGIKSNLFIWL